MRKKAQHRKVQRKENTASEKIPDNVGTEGHANWMIPGDGFQKLVREYPKAGKYPAIKYCNSGQPGSLYYENVFQTVYPENGN